MAKKSAENIQMNISPYVVCMLDALGQKMNFAGWPHFDGSIEQITQSRTAIESTLLAAYRVRRRLLKGFSVNSAALNAIEKKRIDAGKVVSNRFRASQCEIRMQQFSDTYMLYAKTYEDLHEVRSMILFQIIGASASALLESFTARVPLRGGITCGMGAELEPDILYGPVVAEAHKLENIVAGYPRVVVSPSIVDFLKGSINLKSSEMADSLIYKDFDGFHAVDYLGEGMRNLCGKDDPDIQHMIVECDEFAKLCISDFSNKANVCQHQDCRASSDEMCGCEKVEQRYRQLSKYIVSRKKLWNL